MRVGSMFTGYGGIDMAVGGDLAWVSDIDPAACRVLAAHHPHVPNLGDVTAINWGTVPSVDVVTAGYPCQPFSKAGRRQGANDDRHLWPYVADAISRLRPRIVVLENVRDHITMGAADVVGDLAGMGYDARWGVVRASDTGAPHQRARLFIVAYPTIADAGGERHGAGEDPLAMGHLDNQNAGSSRERQRSREVVGNRSETNWGDYAPAIIRWEHVIGRPAPAPATDGRLNPVFVEWMMGLPEGWVTGHGLSRSAALKMLGNGVVPQQAAYAISLLTPVAVAA